MISGTTKSGFAYSVSDGLTKDFRLVRNMKKVMSKDLKGQVDGLIDLVSVVFNDEEQEERFLQHLADENGRIPSDVVFSELKEILDAAAEADKAVKN